MPTKNDIKQLTLAAEQGNILAQFFLGGIYYDAGGKNEGNDNSLHLTELNPDTG